jgi:hypothetical protein
MIMRLYGPVLAAAILGFLPSLATAQQYYAREKITASTALASVPTDPVAATSSCGSFVTGRYVSSTKVFLGSVTGSSRSIRLQKAKALCEATFATACYYNDTKTPTYEVYAGTDTPSVQVVVNSDSNQITSVCKPN